MSLFDILYRVDEICKKYDKYDPDKQRELNTSVDDAFSRVYSIVYAEIKNALRKSEMAAMETNRAKKVAMNAEIRRIKAKLTEEVAKLQKLATKKSSGAATRYSKFVSREMSKAEALLKVSALTAKGT